MFLVHHLDYQSENNNFSINISFTLKKLNNKCSRYINRLIQLYYNSVKWVTKQSPTRVILCIHSSQCNNEMDIILCIWFFVFILLYFVLASKVKICHDLLPSTVKMFRKMMLCQNNIDLVKISNFSSFFYKSEIVTN